MQATRRMGILAGGGNVPREIADSIVAAGGSVFIVGIEGETDADLSAYPGTRVHWGQIGRLLAAFREAGCTDLVIVGRVGRPDLFKIKFDFGLLRVLPLVPKLVRAGGDDALLRRIIQFLEEKGLHLVGPREAAPGLVIGEGPMGRVAPVGGAGSDIALGFEVLRRLGPFDIGQGVVVEGGQLLAVEGVEGTDVMLARVARRRVAAPAAGGEGRGVLVKSPKPGQELRIDVPVIGPETVRRAAEAGLAGIAVRAGQVMAAERSELVTRADAAGLFLVGFDGGRARGAELGISGAGGATSEPVRLGRLRIAAANAVDSRKGAAVIAALAPYGAGRVAVVTRRHVLAVEAGGEGALPVLRRVKGRRQWGRLGFGRRLGVAVVADAGLIDAAAVAAAAEAGLAGIVFLGGPDAAPPRSDVLAAADRAGVFLAGLPTDEGGRYGAGR